MSKPNWDEIRKEWETSKKTYKQLEEQFNVKSSTIRSRKNREKWERNATTKKRNTVATQSKRKKPVVISDNLNDEQRLFCIYYIKYFNATKAYQKAYECAYTTAMVNGHRLLRNTKIATEIDRMKAEQTNELKLDVRDVLQKYIDIAFADITDYVTFGVREVVQRDSYSGDPIIDENGELVMENASYVDLVDYDEVDGTILTEVKEGREGVSVKLADKMKALEMLSKYFDLLSDNDKKRLQEEKLKAEVAKLDREGNPDTSREDKLKEYFAALGGAFSDDEN